MLLGLVVKVLSSWVKVVRVDECFRIARIHLQSNVNPNLFNLDRRRRLTQACDRMMFTRNGEQNGELTSPDFIAAINRSLSIQFRTTWSHVNHKDTKWDTKALSVVTSVHGLADSSNNGISVNRSIFITFREFVSDIEENACISIWPLLDGIGLIDDAEDDGAPQLDDSGADVDIGSDNPSIRLLTATRISSRDALLRIKLSNCVDWYPSSRRASINPNNKRRSCSRSSTFRLRANLRRPSVSSLISQKREFSWQFLQGLEPIHYFFTKSKPIQEGGKSLLVHWSPHLNKYKTRKLTDKRIQNAMRTLILRFWHSLHARDAFLGRTRRGIAAWLRSPSGLLPHGAGTRWCSFDLSVDMA